MRRTLLSLSDLCCCERLALWSIRCLVRHYRLPYCPETKTTDGMFPSCFRPALDAAEQAFMDAADHLRETGLPELEINAPGALQLSQTEERFIRGIQIAQNEGQKATFVLLAGCVPDRLVQGCVATALTLIADCMAGAGHWLPEHEKSTAGAGALATLTRWKSVNPAEMRILWPREHDSACQQTLH
ncbi:hypothetical protein [Gluconobacter morbifer]|uniref:Uncharacterized protein n=1 Tax=Gluconobacter morbifer G707 TaxID=1088869 RepID=G6XLT2_9PROT|nr:hypothetical protein [Gluconobacter morbifer]EHH67337.1 hypothetical protein GMO_23310 [Gluconobacter morbifer G707]